MSQPSSANYGGYVPPVHKPESNVYTMMLVVSFLLIVTACVLCHLELQKFGKEFPQWRATVSVPSVGQ